MSPPLEHDYIALADAAAAEKLSIGGASASSVDGAALKATELRLGPPGSESPDRSIPQPLGLTLGLKTFSSAGAKRGFSDAIIDGASHKWPFAPGGSDADADKNAGLFSPRGDTRAAGNAVKDAAAGGTVPAKSVVAAAVQEKNPQAAPAGAPAAKAQVVGWPPIRSYRKNTMAANPLKNKEDAEGKQAPGCLYVKVSMDGAPYLRKVDLKLYSNYKELSSALEKMFSCFTIGQCGSHGIPGRDGLSKSRLMDLLHGSEYVLTYEDKDSDWMLVGDVPWEIFTDSCKRLRIMKGSDAIGLAPRAMEKCQSRN